MVSYLDLDPNAPFASVFSDKGMVSSCALEEAWNGQEVCLTWEVPFHLKVPFVNNCIFLRNGLQRLSLWELFLVRGDPGVEDYLCGSSFW